MSTCHCTERIGENYARLPSTRLAKSFRGIRPTAKDPSMRRRRHFIRANNVPLVGLLTLSILWAWAEQGAGFSPPWTSAQEASNYIVGQSNERHEKGNLINVSTGQVAGEVTMKDFGNLSRRYYVIDGAPGAFLDINITHESWSSPLETLRLSGRGFVDHGWVFSILPGHQPGGYNGPIKSGTVWAGYYIHENLRQTVWIKERDIWIGDIDWIGCDIVNQRQVTHVGQFELTQHGRNEPHLICWSGQNLFIEAGFDPQKPLVRVNLVDGSVQELDWLMYEGKSVADDVLIDPGERVAVHFRPENIRLIDLTSGKVFKVSWGKVAEWGLNPYRPEDGPLKEKFLKSMAIRDAWISSSRYVVGFTPMPDKSKIGAVVLDVERGELQVTPIPRLSVDGVKGEYYPLRKGQVLPGEKPGIILDSVEFRNTKTKHGAVLIDLDSGQSWFAPASFSSFNFIDSYHLVYAVTDKGLSGNGTFLMDRRTKRSTKLAPFTDFSRPKSVADGKVILLRRGREVYRVNEDGTDLKKLPVGGQFVGTFAAEPVKVAHPGDQPIQPGQPLALFRSEKQQVVSERDRLKQAVKDEEPEIQAFALRVYDHHAENYVFGNFFKRLERTLAVVETRKRMGPLDESTLGSRTNLTSDMVDQEKAQRWFYTRAMDLTKYNSKVYTKHGSRKMTDQEREQVATRTAKKATAELVKDPAPGIDFIRRIFMKALLAEQKALGEKAEYPQADEKEAAGSTAVPSPKPSSHTYPKNEPSQWQSAPGAAESKSEPHNVTAHDNSSPADDSMANQTQERTSNATSYGLVDASDELAESPSEPAARHETHPLNTVFDNGPYADYNSYSRRQILMQAQRKFRQAGLYHSGIDGAMGPGTQAAIVEWQENENIPVTGLLDHRTLRSLYLLGLAEQTPPRKRIYRGEQVREYPSSPDAAEVINRALDWIPH